MRKADYAHLARILNGHMAEGLDKMATPGRDEDSVEERKRGLQQRRTTERIARSFVAGASVDPVEFLKACGLT